MRCPNCGMIELEDFGNMKECPRCHFTTYFSVSRARIKTEPDYDFNF